MAAFLLSRSLNDVDFRPLFVIVWVVAFRILIELFWLAGLRCCS